MPSIINADNGVVSGSVGLKYASDNSGVLALQTNGNTAVTIDATGLVTLPYGQIKFPATQNASSDANTLDDYEEGTWTPTVTPSAGSLTSYTSSGVYTKVGRFVTVVGDFILGTVGTASGGCTVGGFPFLSTGPSGAYRGSIGICREDAYTGYGYQASLLKNGTTANINTMTNGPITWSGSYEYTFTITYMV
jgi:hypothetical protein